MSTVLHNFIHFFFDPRNVSLGPNKYQLTFLNV